MNDDNGRMQKIRMLSDHAEKVRWMLGNPELSASDARRFKELAESLEYRLRVELEKEIES